MSTINTPEVALAMTPAAVVEVKKFMVAENVSPDVGGLRVSVQPGGCSGFKYSLLIEDKPAEDDTIVAQEGFNVFVDPFSMQYLGGMTVDYVTSMQGSGFTFKNPNQTGECGCGESVQLKPADLKTLAEARAGGRLRRPGNTRTWPASSGSITPSSARSKAHPDSPLKAPAISARCDAISATKITCR